MEGEGPVKIKEEPVSCAWEEYEKTLSPVAFSISTIKEEYPNGLTSEDDVKTEIEVEEKAFSGVIVTNPNTSQPPEKYYCKQCHGTFAEKSDYTTHLQSHITYRRVFKTTKPRQEDEDSDEGCDPRQRRQTMTININRSLHARWRRIRKVHSFSNDSELMQYLLDTFEAGLIDDSPEENECNQYSQKRHSYVKKKK